MNITQQDARLILVLMGKSEESGIRPGEMTGEQAGVLIQALQNHARGSEADE